MSFVKELSKGIIKDNPIFILVLGMCPTLAVTTSVINALGMGFAATFVLLCSNIIISLIKNITPSKIRIPVYIVVIASFVSIVDMVMAAYLPGLHKSLGLFIPLIVVNCIILGRAEAFASKNNVLLSIADAIGMGLGFTLSLSVIATIREILGAGTWLGIKITPLTYDPMLVAILAPGAFITLGFLMALMNMLKEKK
ncbi:MAG: electron transport complex subunit E [Candidatus Cloacimonetes bacterium]|jgi:electron transport complex protein RnfE|nr:electron transport complex subunit E [Candidatus Cloacimonadota bacterium]MDY0299170.1 electron transport complex subunit E [Candidatus Cloacimonadaceae bacterium]MCB5279836.1 electron transport complex subunit E [Candidatus Cloacimonadota bacterium]MCK9332069.1 electron transport complex subunit E [Candidatus Cloacimonadota bacterium]MDD2210926.1 electron transport complex subunit E [Candidatus Cloacimonadota bacterium]